jgi:hypothetical protein
MYIGGTDERALHHCISEVLDNSSTSISPGYGKRIEVTSTSTAPFPSATRPRHPGRHRHPVYKIPASRWC